MSYNSVYAPQEVSEKEYGFDKLFEETWRESTISASNAISKFMKKLKFLKEKIRLWTKAKKESSKSQKLKLKEEKQLAIRGILVDGVWNDSPSMIEFGSERGHGKEFSHKKASFHTPKFVLLKSLCVKHVRTIFLCPPLVRESTFGFKPGAKKNKNAKPRHDAENASPQSSPQVLPSFEEHTPPMTYPDEVEETIELSIKVEPLEETPLEDLCLNTCNHDTPLSSREIPSFDEPKPQPQPFPSFSSLEVDLGEERDPEQPIKPPSPNNFRMKEVDHLTIHTPPSPYVAFSTLRMCTAIITHALMILRNIMDLNQVY
ncbi:hypothetical protein Tco_1062031 [Tanacetum coccineum]